METLTASHILLAASDSEYAGKIAQAERAHVLALTSERRKREKEKRDSIENTGIFS